MTDAAEEEATTAGATRRSGRRPAGVLERASGRMAEALVVPGWALILAVFAVPVAMALWLSFRNETLGAFAAPRFVGLENYRAALSDPRFWEALRTTIVIMVLGLAIQLPIGLGLALLLDRQLRGTRLFRTVLTIPMLLTPVAVGLIWRFMFDTDYGVINWLLGQMWLPEPAWLGARWPAVFAVTIVDSWQSIPFVMLIALAGLAGLPAGPREAAAIDGARPWQILLFVTLPALAPVILVILMIRVVDAIKLFDVIFIVTQRGGPGTATQTLGMLIYNTGFIFFQTSRAAALGVLLIAMVAPIYFLWRRAVGQAR